MATKNKEQRVKLSVLFLSYIFQNKKVATKIGDFTGGADNRI